MMKQQKVVKKSSVADIQEDITGVQPVQSFPIVAIGASAGGLAAFESFFAGMPANVQPNMAFVLVQHLSPDHISALAAIVQRFTQMKVLEVVDGVLVVPNCIYVIPPAFDMAILNGQLQLLEPVAPHGQRLTIDFFLRTLAIDQHEHAIAVILSGTGSDGTEGIKAIKQEGGVVMVQTAESTEYDGMPRSAIATGLADYVIPPSAMAKQLLLIADPMMSHAATQPGLSTLDDQNALNKIFVLLRTESGHDFSQYKINTIHRRIERRMNMHQIKTMSEYLKYLQQTTTEGGLLFQDLLIGVTQFFRDADAFTYLKTQLLPKLLNNKAEQGVVRIWSVGCSSGEEAYSLAIMLKEYMDEHQVNFRVQIFATDIDARAIAIARTGVYPAHIVSDVSPERLSRFFIAEDNGQFRIHKNIRDMLIFSEQDMIKDPPFSKIDLLSCRNVLIYMNASLQKKLIPLFHYVLNPEGVLFLGSSESIGEFGDLFSVLSPVFKFFQRKENILGAQRSILGRSPSNLSNIGINMPNARLKLEDAPKRPLRELMEQSLLQVLPVSGALVNEQGDILYLQGRMGRYIELPSGETGVNNILKMACQGLRRELTMALHKVMLSKEPAHYPQLHLVHHGVATVVSLDVRPITNNGFQPTPTDVYLISLVEMPTDGLINLADKPMHTEVVDTRIAALEQELYEHEAFLQLANRKFETSNEALRTFNDEMQSLNEELQSTNEELETSKEELQSLNEELSTVNTELQTKVVDLSRTNNDMNNLLAGSNIGTVFVDHQLVILRFTPAITHIINLIPSDIGRPVGHIVSNLIGCHDFMQNIQTVLDTLIPKELEVQTTEGKWYLMRIQPYRTLENVIEGAVVSFIDITEMVKMRAALALANERARLAVVVHDTYDAITVQDMDGRMIAWNPAAERMYGWTEDEALQLNVSARILPNRQKEELEKLVQLSQSVVIEPYRTQRIAKNGSLVDVWMTSTALFNSQGKMYAIATTERAERAQQL